MKKFEQLLLILLLTATAICLGAALFSQAVAWREEPSTSDLFGTAGLLAALSGFVQLDVTNFFDRLIERYGDEDEFPYGPPSHVTRHIIDNPDQPLRTALRNTMYFNPRTGFVLVCIGTALQIASLWT